jgi:hypothetical protein
VSREQLVDAYLGGHISRRTFVRGLVSLGVSVGAALTYAEVMPARASAANMYNLQSHPESLPSATPSAPAPPDHDTTPPKVGLTAGRASRAALKSGGALAIGVTMSEPGTATVTALLGGKPAGKATLNVPHGGSAHTTLKLTRSGRKALAGHSSITLSLKALDNAGNPARKSISVPLS